MGSELAVPVGGHSIIDSTPTGARIPRQIDPISPHIYPPARARGHWKRSAVTVMKKKSAGKKAVKRTLTLNKKSVKDLTVAQRKQIQGGKAKAIISLVCETGQR